MPNRWISFLQEYRRKHKGLSLKTAMKQASKVYKKSAGGAGAAEPKKKRRRKKKAQKWRLN